jgi:hypothetical protein
VVVVLVLDAGPGFELLLSLASCHLQSCQADGGSKDGGFENGGHDGGVPAQGPRQGSQGVFVVLHGIVRSAYAAPDGTQSVSLMNSRC